MSSFHSHPRGDTHAAIAPALRILCLHDSGSNATELSDRLEALGERLYENHAIDLVYINSPLLIRPPSSSSSSQSTTTEEESNRPNNMNNNNPQRIWWDERREEGKYDGLDASLLLLRQVWTSMPFWGILAVGQGAATGSFLPLMPDLTPPAFCIFVNGETLLKEEGEDERLIDNMPCLHILAPNPGPSSQRLFKQFGGTVHQGGSNFTKTTINVIGKFIVSQKKRLRLHQSADECRILALQNMLYLKEQEAATAVAHHIAANPPKALQAVISPQMMGGFSGGRKRNPEGTGGAPCPPEFLLKKEKRQPTNGMHGPSREHPSQQKEKQKQKQQDEQENDKMEQDKVENNNMADSETNNEDGIAATNESS